MFLVLAVFGLFLGGVSGQGSRSPFVPINNEEVKEFQVNKEPFVIKFDVSDLAECAVANQTYACLIYESEAYGHGENWNDINYPDMETLAAKSPKHGAICGAEDSFQITAYLDGTFLSYQNGRTNKAVKFKVNHAFDKAGNHVPVIKIGVLKVRAGFDPTTNLTLSNCDVNVRVQHLRSMRQGEMRDVCPKCDNCDVSGDGKKPYSEYKSGGQKSDPPAPAPDAPAPEAPAADAPAADPPAPAE